ncbi:DUF5696 domain-containing protein [Paenibacillus thermotolerans]|uniref:DUF5696 domain-containing protein n=1 Tax=Paenibacillus thermotolerans TaxID=3027807 RepID=UPI00236743C8|nr:MULTISPECIES: DUF5696 domain-containing protein [unclassified Paenibacillus]
MRSINAKLKPVVILAAVAALLLAAFVWVNNGRPAAGDGLQEEAPAGQDTAAAEETQSRPLSGEYKKVAENDRLILFLKEENLAIQVQEKQSGYVWSSVVEEGEDSKNNAAWKNFMASGLAIEYFKQDIPKPSRTDLLSEKNKSINIEPTDNGFKAKVYFADLKIGLELTVALEGDQLVVGVDNESIRETQQFQLASVYAYPFLGATLAGQTPGYMFIPDGSGALISLADNKGKYKFPYEQKIYGANEGLEGVSREIFTNDPYSIVFPIFGIVHGEGRHGLLGVVEKGRYNAKIVAYPNGVNTQYNWITAQFLSRESYLQPTSRSLGGVVVHEKERNPEDLQTRYFFLKDQDADYVGMAKTYRNYLEGKGMLTRKAESDADIPIQLEFLGAETENGLFTKQFVPMTTVKQLRDIVDDARSSGVANPLVVYKGWNKGGLTGTSPSNVQFERKLGSAGEFSDLIAYMKEQRVPLYFYDDYTTAYEESGRFAPRSDAVKKVDKTILSVPTFKNVYPAYYFLSADRAKEVAESNAAKYKAKGIAGVAVGKTGSTLFSEWDGGKVRHRAETAGTYAVMMESLKGSVESVLMYAPNDYMLKYADRILNAPMHSSKFIYTSETVPFVQLVLKGYKDYFAPYANFNANSAEDLLRMVEYGAYPSYFLTSESSYKLKFTNSDDVYTSSYKDWKADIVSVYQTVNSALKPVQNATVEERNVLSKDVVEVVYSNGKAIVVNYGATDANVNGTAVPAKGFKVIEVNR